MTAAGRATPPPPAVREAIARHARDALGAVFPPGRARALDAGIARALELLGERDPAALAARLGAREPAALDALAAALTVGETYFFRDAPHFALLRRVLDAAPAAPVRVWSAGCATGEEAYSMAVTALEAFGPRAHERVEVLATDVNPAFLAHARAASYSEWSFRHVEPATRARWFERSGRRFTPLPAVRRLVRFAPLNLLEPDAAAWPRALDVVFCRNVLIYFDAAGAAQVAAGLARALAPGAWLVTGPSDPLLTADGLVVDRTPGFIAYRAATASTATGSGRPPPPALRVDAPAAPPPARPRTVAPRPRVARSETAPPREAPAIIADAGSLERARTLADAGDARGAIAVLDALIARTPLDAAAYVLRATARQAVNDHAGAGADAERALLLDRARPMAHILAATSKAQLGDADGAQRALRNARALLLGLPSESVVPDAGSLTVSDLLAACDHLEPTVARGAPRRPPARSRR